MAESELKYRAGDLSLDFVNTVDWVDDRLIDERLVRYESLVRWAEGASLLSRQAASHLRAQAARRPRQAQAALTKARRIRSLLRAVLMGPDGKDLPIFNRLVARASTQRQIVVASGRARWEWSEEAGLEWVLWPVVWAAAALVTSDEAGSIRVCGGASCGWMFVDRSRNGLRRWCEMETCGTREKSRRRAVRISRERRRHAR